MLVKILSAQEYVQSALPIRNTHMKSILFLQILKEYKAFGLTTRIMLSRQDMSLYTIQWRYNPHNSVATVSNSSVYT